MADHVVHRAVGHTRLGWVAVTATGRGVCRVDFRDDPEIAVNRRTVEDDRLAAEVIRQLAAFIENPVLILDLPLDPGGTEFQRRVWSEIRCIKPGETSTYGQLAGAIGSPNSYRAVASACASNPVAVLIPCHRILRSDGGLGGYRWGIERKRIMLRHEALSAARRMRNA